ncbi:MAG: hypothetical protein QOD11_3257 [Bradyrhizobium sp.]|nr:hypothetical protein [Bradyrhizobium sp.]
MRSEPRSLHRPFTDIESFEMDLGRSEAPANQNHTAHSVASYPDILPGNNRRSHAQTRQSARHRRPGTKVRNPYREIVRIRLPQVRTQLRVNCRNFPSRSFRDENVWCCYNLDTKAESLQSSKKHTAYGRHQGRAKLVGELYRPISGDCSLFFDSRPYSNPRQFGRGARIRFQPRSPCNELLFRCRNACEVQECGMSSNLDLELPAQHNRRVR